MYVRDQGKIHHARAAMENLAKIEADQPVLLTRPGTSGEKSKGKWSVDGIRKARVKFDAYSMLLFRAFFRTLLLSNVAFNLYIDASPQWRGTELFAASFDLLVQGVHDYFRHRLFPQVCIGPLVHTALGKACALLWMVWLMTGPDYYYVQAFLASVYAIITDLGTERIVVNLSDVLPEFFVHIGCKVPADFVRGVYLFPFAIAISGWHHTFDGLVRYGLCSLA
jgi:hypothetical protein